MKKLFCILVFLVRINLFLAQTSKADPTDVQGWFGGTLDINLPHKWTAELDYQARYFNNVRTFNGSYISVGASKEVSDFLAFRQSIVWPWFPE